MSTISGTLRVVGLKGGRWNLAVDMPKEMTDEDYERLTPTVYGMAGQTVTLKRAEIEPTVAENPIDRLIRALRDASNAAIEVAAADPQEGLSLTSEAPDIPDAAQGWPVCVPKDGNCLSPVGLSVKGLCPAERPCIAFKPAPPPDEDERLIPGEYAWGDDPEEEPSIKHPDPTFPVCFTTTCEVLGGDGGPGSRLCTAEAPCGDHTLSEAEAAKKAAESEAEG